MKILGVCLALFGTWLLFGCTTPYPNQWAPLMSDVPEACRSVSGKYRAISDPVVDNGLLSDYQKSLLLPDVTDTIRLYVLLNPVRDVDPSRPTAVIIKANKDQTGYLLNISVLGDEELLDENTLREGKDFQCGNDVVILKVPIWLSSPHPSIKSITLSKAVDGALVSRIRFYYVAPFLIDFENFPLIWEPAKKAVIWARWPVSD